MTQLDVMYRFGAAPSEAASMALGRIREVYGVRKLSVDEAARTVRVEYDATRLTEPIVHQLLRRTGLDVLERVSTVVPPAPKPEAPADAKARLSLRHAEPLQRRVAARRTHRLS